MKNKSKLIFGGLMVGLCISAPCVISQLTVNQPKFAEIAPAEKEIEIEFPIKMETCSNIVLETTEEVTEEKTNIPVVTSIESTEAATAEPEQPQIEYSDLKYLSAIIYAEAGNQCQAGQDAVGIVVMNRVRSGQFPNDIYSVIYQSGQFTAVYGHHFANGLSMYDNGTLPQSCIDAAQTALSGSTSVVYNDEVLDLNGIYFFARYQEYPVYIIQDHQFR